jgi:phosphonate transport system permease protein
MSAVLPPPRKSLASRSVDLVVFGGVAVLLGVTIHAVELRRLPLVLANSDKIGRFAGGFLKPDFALWRLFVVQMGVTLAIALWGTALAIVIAIPLGVAAARNVTPWWIWQPIRRLLDLMRAVPDLVIGYLFIVAVGLGPLTGVLALGINTGGVLAKLFSEAVESIDPGPVEGVRAVGGTRLQEVVWGVLPQVGPLWTSYTLYRFESSARSATVLGLIGAGGIGQLLFDSLNTYAYGQVAAIIIIIIVAVSLIDLLSQALRSRLV